jgi:hypothetical protein
VYQPEFSELLFLLDPSDPVDKMYFSKYTKWVQELSSEIILYVPDDERNTQN